MVSHFFGSFLVMLCFIGFVEVLLRSSTSSPLSKSLREYRYLVALSGVTIAVIVLLTPLDLWVGLGAWLGSLLGFYMGIRVHTLTHKY